MSWAAPRVATRIEDGANSLLEILTLTCPCCMAKEVRLSCVFRKRSSNSLINIFAWTIGKQKTGLLADSPRLLLLGKILEFDLEERPLVVRYD